jgi:hypothetical protein
MTTNPEDEHDRDAGMGRLIFAHDSPKASEFPVLDCRPRLRREVQT